MTRHVTAVITLALLTFAALAVPIHADAPLQDSDYPNCWRFDGPQQATPIPCPTDTPAPTATPEATATHEPTHTATPTATPPIEPSPTVEDARTPSATPPPTWTPSPTVTPSPTATSTPQPGICYGTTTDRLNVRAVPGGSLLGTLDNDQTIRITGYWDYNGARWYQHYWTPDTVGYSHSGWITLSSDADCSDIPDVEPQEPHNAALLWHTVPGFNQANAQNSYPILASKGIEYGLKPYASMNACLDAVQRGGTCIYRHGAPDCPQNIGTADPRQSARDFVQYGQAARQYLANYADAYYEPLNECNFGGPESDTSLSIVYWWRDWMDEYVNQWTAQTPLKLVLPTFGPGHGDPVQYRIWRDVLNRLAAAGGLMGEHAYTPFHDDGLCACDKWLACRHRTNEAYRQAEGVDIDVAITEAARGWGDDPVSVSDFVCWYDEVRHDDWLHSVSLWTAGHHPTWPNANLDGYMVPIAQGVGG